MSADRSEITTYPVGLFAHAKHRKFRAIVRTITRHAKARDRRALRNYFNGYLAEWHYRPDGVRCFKAGRGWTRRAAIRRLGVHIAVSNLSEREAKR